MVCLSTSYFRASSTCVNRPVAYIALISATWSSVKRAVPVFDPRASRRFENLSLMFSCCVPKNKCLGLTHGGLSQRWHTFMPSGMEPR